MKSLISYFFLFVLFVSCSSTEESEGERLRRLNQKAEYIYRTQEDYLFVAEAPKPKERDPYPWEGMRSGQFPKITKEFFRCKGSMLNPARLVQTGGKDPERFHDCGGSERHSLPLKNQKEFIYPILIDLLNDIQNKTGKRVVITTGHRCPEHHAYADSSPENKFSKHMVGAEVSFYVQGMESQPEKIVQLIIDYYQKQPKYKGLKDFQEFTRYEKSDSHVATPPWMNKEVFVKIFKKTEGRNFDNRHPYPYVSIQVRYDWDTQEKVVYSWDNAFKQLLRY